MVQTRIFLGKGRFRRKKEHYVWLSQKQPHDAFTNQVLEYPIARLAMEMDGCKST